MNTFKKYLEIIQEMDKKVDPIRNIIDKCYKALEKGYIQNQIIEEILNKYKFSNKLKNLSNPNEPAYVRYNQAINLLDKLEKERELDASKLGIIKDAIYKVSKSN